ncbi:hypothetical protein AAVH_07159 [Aphelenchoides avenae]|nr:hypothetical protein AAVH_07159 [Aphelenchus avenae]
MASRMLLCSLLFTLCGAALQLQAAAAISSSSSDDDKPTLSTTSSVIPTKGSSTSSAKKATTTKKLTTTVAKTPWRKPTTTTITTTSVTTTPTEPCKRLWLMEDRCGEWILEFPVFLITRRNGALIAVFQCDIDEFCPPNEVMSYIKGMWLDLSPKALPAEFIIPCVFMRERIPRFQYTWQQIPAINSSEMRELRKVYYESTVRGFDANVKEDSAEVFTCRDKHGNAQIPSHGRPNACEYAMGLSVNSRGPHAWYWTTNNYRELVDHYADEYGSAQLVAEPGSWSPFVRHTTSNDTCSIAIGHSVEGGNVEIEYEARCTCTLSTSKCEPLRLHPLDGICPRQAITLMIHNSEFEAPNRTRDDARTPVPDGNAFNETCRAQITFLHDADARMKLHLEFGVDLLDDKDANCENNWYKERQCVLLTDECYRNVKSTPSKACCLWGRCDPRVDASCATFSSYERQAGSGLMGLIHRYLINSNVSGTHMRQELINAVGYCRHHSNERTKGYRDDAPKYCLVFVDVHWPDAFVNISLGRNFLASHGEERAFESYINSDNVTDAILIHGRITKFCAVDAVPTREPNGHVEARRIVAVWKCRTKESEPWNMCDEDVTRDQVLGLVEKPLCYVGKAREDGDKSHLWVKGPDPLNVLCYFTHYADENGAWDEYGWFDPHEKRFEKYHNMDCFETDGMNCNKDDDRIFCCCRTSAMRTRICNAPEADLWEQYSVKHQLRDPQGMQTNAKERKMCEKAEPKSSKLKPEKVVAGFIEDEMCYLEVAAHTSNDTDINHEQEHDVRKLYQRPMSVKHPLAEVLCRRDYWSTLNWLDGCSCRAYLTDGLWTQYCCCIAREGDRITTFIDKLHKRHLLRLNDFTH